jgi:hypothetical protein
MSYAHSMTMIQVNKTVTVYHRNQGLITAIEPNEVR